MEYINLNNVGTLVVKQPDGSTAVAFENYDNSLARAYHRATARQQIERQLERAERDGIAEAVRQRGGGARDTNASRLFSEITRLTNEHRSLTPNFYSYQSRSDRIQELFPRL